MDSPIFVSTRHVDAPWIAADLAVLNEAAVDVGLDVDLQLLAAKRTRDQELVRHLRRSYCNDAGQTAMQCTRISIDAVRRNPVLFSCLADVRWRVGG